MAPTGEQLPQTVPRTPSSTSSAHMTWPGGSKADPYEVPDSEDERLAAQMISRRSGREGKLEPTFKSSLSLAQDQHKGTQPAACVLIDLSQDDSDEVIIETPHRPRTAPAAQPCKAPQLVVDSDSSQPASAKRKRDDLERSPPRDRDIRTQENQEPAKKQRCDALQIGIKQGQATTASQSPKGRAWPCSQRTLAERASAAMTPPNSDVKPAGPQLPPKMQLAGLPRTRERMITQFLDDGETGTNEPERWQEKETVASSPHAHDTARVHFFLSAAETQQSKEAGYRTSPSDATARSKKERDGCAAAKVAAHKHPSDEQQEKKSEPVTAALQHRNLGRPSPEVRPPYRGPWPQQPNGASVKFTPRHRDSTLRPRSVLKTTPGSQTYPSPAVAAAAHRDSRKPRSSSSTTVPSRKGINYNSEEEMAKSEAVVSEIKEMLVCKAQKKAWDEEEAEKKRRDEEQHARLFAKKPPSGMKLTPIPKVREAYFLGEPLGDDSDSDSDGAAYGFRTPSDSGSDDYWQGRHLRHTFRDAPQDCDWPASDEPTSKQHDEPSGLSEFKPIDTLSGPRKRESTACQPPIDDEEYWEQRRKDRERRESNVHAKSNLAVAGFAEVQEKENEEVAVEEKQVEQKEENDEKEEDEEEDSIPDHQVDPVSSPASPGLLVVEGSLEDVFAPVGPRDDGSPPPAIVKNEPSSPTTTITDRITENSRKSKSRRKPRSNTRAKTTPFRCQVRRRRLHDRPLADVVNDPQVKILVKGRQGTEVRSLSDVVAMFALQGTAAF